MDIEGLLKKYGKPGCTVGVIGAGAFGTRVAECAEQLGMTVILNDPPRENAQSDDIYNAILTQWGNGMGGCESTGAQFETFMPLSVLLKCADLISVQVPLTPDTTGLISAEFISAMRKNAVVLNFSGDGVVSVHDPRIVCPL